MALSHIKWFKLGLSATKHVTQHDLEYICHTLIFFRYIKWITSNIIIIIIVIIIIIIILFKRIYFLFIIYFVSGLDHEISTFKAIKTILSPNLFPNLSLISKKKNNNNKRGIWKGGRPYGDFGEDCNFHFGNWMVKAIITIKSHNSLINFLPYILHFKNICKKNKHSQIL